MHDRGEDGRRAGRLQEVVDAGHHLTVRGPAPAPRPHHLPCWRPVRPVGSLSRWHLKLQLSPEQSKYSDRLRELRQRSPRVSSEVAYAQMARSLQGTMQPVANGEPFESSQDGVAASTSTLTVRPSFDPEDMSTTS